MEQQIRQETPQIRADMHQTELRLQKEIAEVHLKIEMTSKKTGAVDGGLVFYLCFYPDCGEVWGECVVTGFRCEAKGTRCEVKSSVGLISVA